jgi:hypothetical protein
LPITTHIKTKPTSQESKVVSVKENFLEIIKIEIANSKDHNHQTAPLIGSDGNTNPRPP